MRCDAMWEAPLCSDYDLSSYHSNAFICTTILAASIQAQLNWYSCPLTKSRVYIQLSECVFLLFVFSSDKYVQKIARIHYIAWPISIEFDCHIELMTNDAVIAMQRWMLHLFPGNALKILAFHVKKFHSWRSLGNAKHFMTCWASVKYCNIGHQLNIPLIIPKRPQMKIVLQMYIVPFIVIQLISMHAYPFLRSY